MKHALLTLFVAGSVLPALAAAPTDDWKLVKRANGVSIYTRPHPGSKLKEFKAIGEVDATSHIVHKVIDDVEAYPQFMPYNAEANVIERKQDSILTYQRISPKIVGDRDYTIRIQKKSWPAQNGVAYLSEWKQANQHGPAEKPGVFRVNLVDGETGIIKLFAAVRKQAREPKYQTK